MYAVVKIDNFIYIEMFAKLMMAQPCIPFVPTKHTNRFVKKDFVKTWKAYKTLIALFCFLVYPMIWVSINASIGKNRKLVNCPHTYCIRKKKYLIRINIRLPLVMKITQFWCVRLKKHYVASLYLYDIHK